MQMQQHGLCDEDTGGWDPGRWRERERQGVDGKSMEKLQTSTVEATAGSTSAKEHDGRPDVARTTTDNTGTKKQQTRVHSWL